MKLTKNINFGEYLIVAVYDDITGSLEVTVLDELDGVIEMINITNDEDNDDIDNNSITNPSLN